MSKKVSMSKKSFDFISSLACRSINEIECSKCGVLTKIYYEDCDDNKLCPECKNYNPNNQR